ncbi:MAG: stage II sporulation protein P [Lachnotalea sp.]
MVVFSGMENPLNSVINTLTTTIGKNAMNTYMPGVTFSIANSDEGSFTQTLIDKILKNYPVYQYFDENNGYTTTADSEYTYDMIIAAEAVDENYVDHETGDVINGTGNLVAEENEQYINKENNDSDRANANNEATQNSDIAQSSDTIQNGEAIQSSEAAQNNDITQSDEVANGELVEEVESTQNEVVETNSNAVVTGAEYSLAKLADFDFLKNTFYSVDATTSINSEKLNAKNMIEKDLTLQEDSSVPQILIYHTHSQEAFVDSVPGDSSTSIVGVGEYLAQILANDYGYNVIHDTSTYDMINGKLDRNYAFTLAEPDIERILQENPSIQVVIDIHRDGVNENTHLVTAINGKATAKFMFFNGLSYKTNSGNIEVLYNPYIEDNLAFSFQMQLQAAKYYPDLTRKIYLKGYRYNLHLMPRATLVEVGGQTNTLEEAKNAMEPLADILDKVLKGN